jgi:predicted amino acid dehydrogenase
MRVDTDQLKYRNGTGRMSVTAYSITANIKSLYHTALFHVSFLGNKNTRCKSVICGLLFCIFLAVAKVLDGQQTGKQTR